MNKLLALLLLLPSLALAEVTTGPITWVDSLGYTKPRFYPITLPTESGVANKYYVNLSGGSGSTCSEASPCGSLSAVAGKTGTTGGPAYIYVKGTGQIGSPSLYGTAGNEVVIKPWPAGSTGCATECSADFRGNRSDWNSNRVQYVVFDGGNNLRIKFTTVTADAFAPVIHFNSPTAGWHSNITFYRTQWTLTGAGEWFSQYGRFDNLRFINSEFYANGSTVQNAQHQMYFSGASNYGSSSNLSILNNIFRDTPGEAIEFRMFDALSGVTIDGNAFHDIGKGTCSVGWRCRSAITIGYGDGASMSSFLISNNLIWDTGEGCIRPWESSAHQFYNNTCYNWGMGNPVNGSWSNWALSGDTSPNAPDATVRNNIFYAEGTTSGGGAKIPWPSNPAGGASNNMCKSGTSCGTSSRSYTVGSVFLSIDENNADFLKPATTVGQALGGASSTYSTSPDYFGNTRPTAGSYDLGAIQVSGSAAPSPPTLTLTSNQSLRTLGQAYTLTWTVGGGAADSCTFTGGLSGDGWARTITPGVSGSMVMTAVATATYGGTCTGSGGTTQNQPATVTVAPPLVGISASPLSLYEGSDTTVTWTASNVGSVNASYPGSGTCTASGTIAEWTASPSKTTTGGNQPNVTVPATGTVGISCTSTAGTTVAQAVTVFASPLPPPPTITFYATPTSITVGSAVTLTWVVSGAASCTGSGATQGNTSGWNSSKSASGGTFATGNLAADAPYTLTCTATGGATSSQSLTVDTTPAPIAPTASLTITPDSVISGDTYLVEWACTDSTSATATGAWSGTSIGTSGSLPYTLSPPRTFGVDCTGAGGTRSASATVNAIFNPPTPVEVTFYAEVGGEPIANGSEHPPGTVINLLWLATGETAVICEATGDYAASGLPAADEVSMPALSADITVTMTCGDGYSTDVETLTFYKEDVAVIPTASISVSPASVLAGATYRVTWACTDSDAANSSWSGAVATSGYVDLTTTPPQTLTIDCTDTGSATTRSASATVNLTPPVNAVITNISAWVSGVTVANGSTHPVGTVVTLAWLGDFATSCAATGDWTSAGLARYGTHDLDALTAGETQTVTITCTDGFTSSAKTLTVYGEDAADPDPTPVPTLTLTVAPLNVLQGGSAILTWDSTDAVSCVASGGWSGTKGPEGTEPTPALGQTTRFNLLCTGLGGTVYKSTAVTVRRTTRPRCRWWRCR